MFKILISGITAVMTGNEFVLKVNAQPVGIGFQQQPCPGIFSGNRIAIGVKGDSELAGCSHLADGGDIKIIVRQRVKEVFSASKRSTGLFRVVPCIRTLAVSSSHDPAAGAMAPKSGISRPARKFFLTYPTAFSTRPFSFPFCTLQGAMVNP